MVNIPRLAREYGLAAFAFAATLSPCAAQTASPQKVQRPAFAICDPTKMQPTAWDDCLRKAQADTDKAIEDGMTKFKTALDARTDLSGSQRALLKRQIGESNDLWTRYRNHLCQNVVPMLAGPRAKIYEENLACVIDLNINRKNELGALLAPR